MEQIIITRKDGTTYPLAVKKEATDIKEARQTWGLLGDDVVNITVESPYPQHYEIGDYFNVFGRTYKLNQLPRVRKSGAHKYTYELTFEGVQYDLLRAFYDVTIETTGNTLQDVQGDALTGNLHRFATVLVSNANRVFPNKWKLGACPDTIADKTLTFGDGDNCLAVYQNLCRTFEVEADITQKDGVYTINFYKRVGTTHPFVFEFGKGKGLYALDRQNVDSSNIVTRLKVFGSDDNITNKYRANRLCLPGKSKAQSFIEQSEAVQKYGIHEARKIFEDIKPTFDGAVTAVVSGSVLQFKDTSMFDLNAKEADGKTTKYLVAGVSAKIHFNTGNLAGYEFDIHKYDHATRTFTLKKLTDDRGDVFPSETSSAFQFAKGDKYKILDVTLPELYQQEAERKLQERANEYYKQNSQPKVKYGLSVAKSYLKTLFGEDAQVTLFSPGDYINVKDESIGVDKAVRIQSLVRNLLDVYDYTLTLSDVAENNITTRVISELVEIDKITTTHQLKDPTRAKANWRSSREVMGMVFDPDGDYYTDKIKPNSIDTLALSVGAKSMQFALQNVVFEPNYQGQKNLVRVSAGTLTHYTIEEQPRMWAIAQAIVGLNEDTSAYYIFAKCDKANSSASITFSKAPIKTEEVAGYYHFWIGVVNSVDTTLQARPIALSYGFSMINGRFIKTGRVESADGSTYFDLDDSEFGGKINFKDGVVSGDIGVGNEYGINAGLSGQGNSATDVRFYAGATKSRKKQAPFRVLHDGTVFAEKAVVKGEVHANRGTFNNGVFNHAQITGSIRNTFSEIGDSFDTDFNDNVAVISVGGGWVSAYSLPWDVSQSGRRITVVNYKWGQELSMGASSFDAPAGKFFYEDGIAKSELKQSRELVELLGYGTPQEFYGWIVVRRIDIMTKYSYGRGLKILAQGQVMGWNNGASMSAQRTFDGSSLSVERIGEGKYKVTFPTKWIHAKENYIVMLTGFGYAHGGSTPLKASLAQREFGYFVVDTSDDASRNDGSFFFQITNLNDWGG